MFKPHTPTKFEGLLLVILAIIGLYAAFLPDPIKCQWWGKLGYPCEAPINTPEPIITDEPAPITPTPVPTTKIEPIPTPIPIYEEDFQDGIAQDWFGNDVWLVGSNNEANTYFYKSTAFTGYRRTILNSNQNLENISVQFRVHISTYLHIYFCRPTPSANYVLNIDRSNNYISLYDYERSGSEPRSQPFIFEDSEWHNVRIEIRGQQVTATVDEVTLVPYIVPNCYNGNILLGLGSDNAAFIDDIRVWSLDDSQ
jgi:hypothetical protein